MKKIAFTLVLNGMPFIKQQAEIIPDVFDVWYIIEGATLPIKDTAWCRNIDSKYYSDNKLSVDGTTEFLNSIASEKIKIIRKNDFWNGKVEMCNIFMPFVDNAILMEFDVDEIWKKEVLIDVLDYAEKNNHFDVMLFKCNYFVGPNLHIVNEDCYGNPSDHWPRLWRVLNKTQWLSHEPPRISDLNRYLKRSFTKNKGWIFDHYSYVQPEQVAFKENFYGYMGALDKWEKLQNNDNFPCLLRNYLPWVQDGAIVDKIK
jgi:hypothetical protein